MLSCPVPAHVHKSDGIPVVGPVADPVHRGASEVVGPGHERHETVLEPTKPPRTLSTPNVQ